MKWITFLSEQAPCGGYTGDGTVTDSFDVGSVLPPLGAFHDRNIEVTRHYAILLLLGEM
jgi:hypothetical protein